MHVATYLGFETLLRGKGLLNNLVLVPIHSTFEFCFQNFKDNWSVNRYLLVLFPGLPRFFLFFGLRKYTEAEERSSASVYYTECKPKNKKWGRPGNEARFLVYQTRVVCLTDQCSFPNELLIRNVCSHRSVLG